MGGCGCYALMTAIYHPSFTLSDDDERAALEKDQTKMSVTTLHNNKSSNKSLTVFTIFHVISVTRGKGALLLHHKSQSNHRCKSKNLV